MGCPMFRHRRSSYARLLPVINETPLFPSNADFNQMKFGQSTGFGKIPSVLGDPKTPLNIFDGCLIDFFLVIEPVHVPAIIQCFGWQYCTGIIGEFLGWRE